MHLGPTASLLAAYLKAMTKASLEPLCIMLAMQMRPLSSWSATFRNLSRGLAILDLKLPSRSTVELAFSRPLRGMRTSAVQSGQVLFWQASRAMVYVLLPEICYAVLSNHERFVVDCMRGHGCQE